MRTLIQDLVYGARLLLRQPGYSLVIILTLALAIGANAVIFSFTNVLLIRPLPMKHQESLGWIFTIDPQRGGDRSNSSLPISSICASHRSRSDRWPPLRERP